MTSVITHLDRDDELKMGDGVRISVRLLPPRSHSRKESSCNCALNVLITTSVLENHCQGTPDAGMSPGIRSLGAGSS